MTKFKIREPYHRIHKYRMF